MKIAGKLIVATLCAAVVITATAAQGLTPSSYVEVGDTIVDMLDTNTLAFSTILLGMRGTPHPMLASFANDPARTQSFTTPCPGGGSVRASVVDRDASGDVSVQDRFVTVFDACRTDCGIVSGSSEFVIAANRTLNGVETTELEFRIHHLGNDAMRGSMTTDGDVLRLVQDDPFVIAPGGPPRSGRLTATDTEGDRLEVEAGRRRYAYRFFARGNRGDAPNSSSQSKPRGG